MKGLPASYRELKAYRPGDTLPEGAPPRPDGASNIYLYDVAAGTGVWVTHYETDTRDGVPDRLDLD